MVHPNGDQDDNFGILGISCYFPKTYVSQGNLEKEYGVDAGKYTIGLGQSEMGVCSDREDVVSLSLTVVKMLLSQYNIDPASIGFLEVGSETLIDKSKGVTTELMALFGENTDIEGADVKNACFGGTQAVFHALDWLQANYSTEKRLSMAVLSDIAVYEEGPARCTGGAGAMAILLGPNAPIVFDKGLRSFHKARTWDFYKPVGCHNCEYPMVAGRESLESYMGSLLKCYAVYSEKAKKLNGEDVCLSNYDGAMFHSPYTKLVRKAVANLIATDARNGSAVNGVDEAILTKLREEPSSGNVADVTKTALAASEMTWEELTSPNLTFNRRIGNMYTPSLFVQLLCYLARDAEKQSSRAILFAYGSGAIAAMFSLSIDNSSPKMQRIRESAVSRLDDRVELTGSEYLATMKQRETFYIAPVPSTPASLSSPASWPLFPGTFFLSSIDGRFRREYQCYEPHPLNGH